MKKICIHCKKEITEFRTSHLKNEHNIDDMVKFHFISIIFIFFKLNHS